MIRGRAHQNKEQNRRDKAVFVQNKSGLRRAKGWLKKDTLDPDRINIYDENGRQKGYLKKDTLNPDNWRFKIKAKDRSRLR